MFSNLQSSYYTLFWPIKSVQIFGIIKKSSKDSPILKTENFAQPILSKMSEKDRLVDRSLFPQLGEKIYFDNAGAALYNSKHVDRISEALKNTLLGKSRRSAILTYFSEPSFFK